MRTRTHTPSRITHPCAQEELKDAVAGVQAVSVVEHWVAFGNCAQCVTGYSRCGDGGVVVGVMGAWCMHITLDTTAYNTKPLITITHPTHRAAPSAPAPPSRARPRGTPASSWTWCSTWTRRWGPGGIRLVYLVTRSWLDLVGWNLSAHPFCTTTSTQAHPAQTHHPPTQSLQDWAREWGDVVMSTAGISTEAAAVQDIQVVPVFVFDANAKGGWGGNVCMCGTQHLLQLSCRKRMPHLSQTQHIQHPLITPPHPPTPDPVLLDGWRQAVPLPTGAVVAAASGHASVPSFFGCHAKQLHVDPRELHRPVLAAVLQAGAFLFCSGRLGVDGWSTLS
jgi:hypothetical protein